jgi:microsomal dipeptidase-like Zn-dependent dipeptidase
MKVERAVSTIMILALIIFLGCAQKPMTEEQIIQLAKDIHERAITLDTHVDIAGERYATAEIDPGIDNPRLRCDLVKMNKGGMDGVFLAVYVGQRDGGLDAAGYARAYETAKARFEAIHRLTRMYPDRCELARNTEDLERILPTGKRAIMIGVENGYPVGMDLTRVKEYYDLGARYITLSHSAHNQICDSSSPDEPMHDGLSDFGRQVVAEMNRLGIMVDVSHISEKSYWDVIETSKAPIIASHSGVTALNDHNRNLTDDQLRALVQNGGVIQIIALGSFLKAETPEHREAIDKLRQEMELPTWGEVRRMSREEREALRPKFREFERRREEIEGTIPGTTLQDMVDHIDHAVKIAGIDHVGIGTDFDGGGGIAGFKNHAEAMNVTVELVRRGYSEEDIMKIWGGNLLRVWKEVERVAAELQG